MIFRRFLVILLLLVLPLQAVLAASDSCCAKAKVMLVGEPAADTTDAPSPDGSCCTQCDFCHHFHAPFVALPSGVRQQADSIAPVPTPEPPIHSFIADIPPRPDRLR
ncbi:hypothetical protein [Pseudoduganella violaceinigra]|uniref:hypothetical protein n=1 Tax=Pseudoduganella violaceinigra TaxID=246602 RepID=UPI0013768A1C|nr:hypothetical protein [Pseudoduganella violaceinigra]